MQGGRAMPLLGGRRTHYQGIARTGFAQGALLGDGIVRSRTSLAIAFGFVPRRRLPIPRRTAQLRMRLARILYAEGPRGY